jgi:hypothetical protein
LTALALGAGLLALSPHRHWAPMPDMINGLYAGKWKASTAWRGPSSPPRGFEDLELTITTATVADADGLADRHASGTVAWDGVAWPMTIEWSVGSGPFCRYAEGHPFTDAANPDGFSFNMLSTRDAIGGDRWHDQLYIDFDRVGCKDPEHSLENAWYRFERSD